MTTIPVPTSADIAAAVERCTPLLRRTPVLATTPGDLGLSVSVTLKLESLQHAGSINALNIHPENAPLTVAAQATLGVELLEQVPDVDTVLVAVGGGGLAAGLRLALPSSVRLVAVETEACNAFHAAVAREPVDVSPAGVGADALGARRVGELPWSILAETTPAIVVDDASVTTARRDLWAQYQLAVEPSAAVALAALQTGAYRSEPGERVVAVVCGGTTDPADLLVI